jgi:hypothetical protein
VDATEKPVGILLKWPQRAHSQNHAILIVNAIITFNFLYGIFVRMGGSDDIVETNSGGTCCRNPHCRHILWLGHVSNIAYSEAPRARSVELHPKMIQIQQIFAYCDDPLSVQISGEQPIACRKLDGSFFSATGGLFFGANQHPPDLRHPVGHLLPSSLGRASLSELLMRLQ